VKLQTGTELTALDGTVLQDSGRELTVGRAIAGALARGPGQNAKLSPAQAADYYCLAMELYNSTEVELTSEQVTTCKQAVADAYTPLVSGQIAGILEQKQ
jgi:hypothetical protein